MFRARVDETRARVIVATTVRSFALSAASSLTLAGFIGCASITGLADLREETCVDGCADAGGADDGASLGSLDSATTKDTAPPCRTGLTLCNGACVDLASDTINCGTCGNACVPGAHQSASCALGACVFACNTGFLDCAGTGASCATDATSDPKSCGACGHDCLGGVCSGGACQPVALASAQNDPFGLAIDSTYVYWTNQAGAAALRVPITGGAAEVLNANLPSAAGIAVDSTNAYVALGASNGSIVAIPLSGGSTTTLASSQSSPLYVVVAGGQVYWTNAVSGGSVMSVAVTGGSPSAIATGQSVPWGIAASATSIVWTNYDSGGGVFSAPLGGGSMTTVASNQDYACAVATDGTTDFFATDAIAMMKGAIAKVAAGGGAISTIAMRQAHPAAIAFDASWVYWTDNGTDAVMRAPVGGGTATVLAAAQHAPRQIAVDASAVYWIASGDGTVMKLAK
jgi:hypothetical protein